MLLIQNLIYSNTKFFQYKLLYNRNLLLKLFDDIFTNGTRITWIKIAIVEIENKETISKDKKKDELV